MEIRHSKFVGPEPHAYRIDSDGSFWSRHVPGSRGRKMGEWRRVEPYDNGPPSHHRFVRISEGGRMSKRYIHRLVLELFVGPCPTGMECRHLDGDPSNNRLENLAWGTRTENSLDKSSHGTHRGDMHPQSKLKESDIGLIRELASEIPGVKNADLGILFDVSESTIRAVRKGRNWAWMDRDADQVLRAHSEAVRKMDSLHPSPDGDEYHEALAN